MPAPTTVAEVVARMEEILAKLDRADGVACFTRLYLDVTAGVERELATATFGDAIFLAQLDVVFASLFFDAADMYARDARTVPRAWAPVFEERSRPGIAPLQFALAGMNAHINRDLPVALVATCEDSGIELRVDSPQHRDFLLVNDVLARVLEQVKRQYLSGWLSALDRLLHRAQRLDDVVAIWNVRRARDAAWTNGEALWALRGDPRLSAEYLLALDRTVGFAGRGLLVPADTTLGKLSRWVHRLRLG